MERKRKIMYMKNGMPDSIILILGLLIWITSKIIYIFLEIIIIENVFSLPGIGKLIIHSISSRDFPLLQGLTVYLAAMTLTCNFAVDILYSIIDPRTRSKK